MSRRRDGGRRGSAFLLQSALGYTLDIVGDLDAEALPSPTPCPGWDVHTLLRHLIDGLAVLGGTDPEPGASADPVGCFSRAACRLLLRTRLPACPTGSACAPGLARTAVAVGAIEVAVHGWDVAKACGRQRRLPGRLAAELADLAPLLVPAAARPGLFATPVPIPPHAAPGERLLAFLGRDPAGLPDSTPTTTWEKSHDHS